MRPECALRSTFPHTGGWIERDSQVVAVPARRERRDDARARGVLQRPRRQPTASQAGSAARAEVGSPSARQRSSRSCRSRSRTSPRRTTDVTFEVDGPGTGDGFALFCEDGSDIANRFARDRRGRGRDVRGCRHRVRRAEDRHRRPVGHHLSRELRVTCLWFGDLYSLFGPESVGFENWSDADGLAAEVGGDFGELHAPYEDAALDITAPGEESGTYSSFIDLATRRRRPRSDSRPAPSPRMRSRRFARTTPARPMTT